jgi:DNA polymerase III subunit delta'
MNAEGIKGHQRQIRNLEFLLKSNKIPQAVIFTGSAGTGKRLLAKRFLNALFCKSANPPCLSCLICRQIDHETFPDLIELSPNEKGIIPIGDEDSSERGSVRWLINRLTARSISGKTGILIDGVDRITEEGQNALLKTIEEPSSGTCFLMISSNRNNILQTILSRCTEIRFFPLSDSDVKEIMNSNSFINNLSSSPDGLDNDTIAGLSGGSVEIAKLIADADTFNNIIGICKAISTFLCEDQIFDADIGVIQNKIQSELFLDVIINIFRQNLLAVIRQKHNISPLMNDVFINDKQKIINIIKILIFLKRSSSNNLNIKYAFKGLLYGSANVSADRPVTTLYSTGVTGG